MKGAFFSQHDGGSGRGPDPDRRAQLRSASRWQTRPPAACQLGFQLCLRMPELPVAPSPLLCAARRLRGLGGS